MWRIKADFQQASGKNFQLFDPQVQLRHAVSKLISELKPS